MCTARGPNPFELLCPIPRLLLGVALGLFSLLLPAVALADVSSCSSAHESGQEEARQGRLRKAVELFATCGSDETCPDVIRKDCMKLFSETDKSLPTVTFSVVAGTREIANVRVYSDEQLLTSELDGRAMPLDPGRHRFRFVLPRGSEVSSDVLLREGEKNRLVTVRAQEPPAPAAPAPASEATTVAPGPRKLPPSFWIASGLGVTAVASGTVFALLGRGEEQRVADCAPSCPPDRRSSLDRSRSYYLAANISFATAIVSAGAATVIYFTTPSHASPPPPVVSGLSLKTIALRPSREGIDASVGFSFGAL
jgi:hypothetical protein